MRRFLKDDKHYMGHGSYAVCFAVFSVQSVIFLFFFFTSLINSPDKSDGLNEVILLDVYESSHVVKSC